MIKYKCILCGERADVDYNYEDKSYISHVGRYEKRFGVILCTKHEEFLWTAYVERFFPQLDGNKITEDERYDHYNLFRKGIIEMINKDKEFLFYLINFERN